MKKLVLLLVLLFVVGCQNQAVASSNIESYIKESKEFAEVNQESKEYISALEEFNEFLEGIEDERYSEYVAIQTEANNMRIEGLKNDDSELITESSFKQAQALNILNQIEGS